MKFITAAIFLLLPLIVSGVELLNEQFDTYPTYFTYGDDGGGGDISASVNDGKLYLVTNGLPESTENKIEISYSINPVDTSGILYFTVKASNTVLVANGGTYDDDGDLEPLNLAEVGISFNNFDGDGLVTLENQNGTKRIRYSGSLYGDAYVDVNNLDEVYLRLSYNYNTSYFKTYYSNDGSNFTELSEIYAPQPSNNFDIILEAESRNVAFDQGEVYYDNFVISDSTEYTVESTSNPDLTFTLNSDGTEYSVSDCIETASGSLDIPSIHNGLPVTSIGNYAFYNCTSLSSITIPDSVTSIGDSAFWFCTSLSSITIGDGVTSIGDTVFNGCTSLTSITFEGDAPTLGTDVFDTYNSNLTVYYYDDATGFSSQTFQGRSSQMLIRDNPQFQIIEGDYASIDAIKADALSRGGRLAKLDTPEKHEMAVSALSSKWQERGIISVAAFGLENESGVWLWVDGAPLDASDDRFRSGEGSSSQMIAMLDANNQDWIDGQITSLLPLTFYILEKFPEPLAPVLDLETFYESNSGESITIDATPTDGYPRTYTYQWSYKAIGNNSYFVIPSNFGGTAANYQISGDSGNNGTWKVEVTNDAGSITKEFNYRVYADSDNDGLSDGQEEFVLGTDPNDNDSDDDTLLDGTETNTGIWVSALDTGTDPLSNDSDGDGLSDGYELSLSEFSIIQIDSNNWYDAKLDAENRGGSLAILNTEERINQANDYLSNRVTWDNLWIGLKYNTEQQQFEWVNNEALTSSNWDLGEPNFVELTETVVYIHPSYANNPLKWNNHAAIDTQTNTYLLEMIADPNNPDTDGDGLLDGVESGSGIYIDSQDTGTNPLEADSDSDGIIDGYETATGIWHNSNDTGTDPNTGDSDGDLLSDGVETNSGTYVSLSDTGTNPNSTDSDGDGFTDKFEIDTSYDPTSSDDTPDAYSFIETAVEVNFYGANGGIYRIEHTDDIESDVWVTVENDIEGSSELIERLYSTDDYSRRFFRVVRTDQ